MENQLTILSESLDEKLELLKEIQEYNRRQEECFRSENVDLDAFDAAVDEKGALIERLNRLDEGFEILYDKLAKQLQENREKYSVQIAELQHKIAGVMELSVAIQAQEKRNKKLVEDYFARERANIGRGRRSSKAAYDYYKSMSGSNYAPPQFYDNKK